MSPELAIDLVRYAHLLCVAIGLGTSVVADYLAFRSLTRPITAEFIHTIHSLHRLVAFALAGMWMSGLLLVYIRTGFAFENFTPKLDSKLLIVTILTLNALLIGRLAIPSLAANVGRSVFELSLPQMVGAALISGFSTTSWLIALLMGVSKVVAKSGWPLFLVGIPVAYALSVIASAMVLIVLHSRVNRMQRQQAARLRRAARQPAQAAAEPPSAETVRAIHGIASGSIRRSAETAPVPKPAGTVRQADAARPAADARAHATMPMRPDGYASV